MMTVFKGYRGVRESVKWHSVTQRMRSDERVNKNSSMSSLGRDWYWQRGEREGGLKVQKPLTTTGLRCLFFFYLLVISVWERQEGANTALEKKTDTKIRLTFCSSSSFISTASCTFWDGAVIAGLYVQNRSVGTYVTSLREVLSSLPRFRMYCHCSSDRLWPPM